MTKLAILGTVLVGLAACSSSKGGGTGAGGSTAGGGSGGTTGTGGAAGSGGATASGGTGAGGAAGSGGATARGGVGGNGGNIASGGASGSTVAVDGGTPPAVSCTAELTGSSTRPLLTAASAACYTAKNYLAEAGPIGAMVRDDWDPTGGLPSASSLTSTYTVAADGSGTHSTVQAAIDAAMASGSTSRVYILVKPGTYRELVCVKGRVPVTLYGADADVSRVVIAYDNYNSKTVDAAKVNACASPSGATYGTSGSTTFFVNAASFQAMNLTIANDTDDAAVVAQASSADGGGSPSLQAVAVTVQADMSVFENVRVRGNQDTLQVKSAATTTVARSYFKRCAIEGDVDFIFGRGTAVFDDCTLTYVSSRKKNGSHLAPSTHASNPFGFLIVNSTIVGDSGMSTGTASLGRAWDDSSDPGPSGANGQAVIRDTKIGGHINVATPWAASTGSRPFSPTDNRLYEYNNSGLGAAGGGVDGGVSDAALDAGAPPVDVAMTDRF